jgi:hypothetical protein
MCNTVVGGHHDPLIGALGLNLNLNRVSDDNYWRDFPVTNAILANVFPAGRPAVLEPRLLCHQRSCIEVEVNLAGCGYSIIRPMTAFPS